VLSRVEQGPTEHGHLQGMGVSIGGANGLRRQRRDLPPVLHDEGAPTPTHMSRPSRPGTETESGAQPSRAPGQTDRGRKGRPHVGLGMLDTARYCR